MVLGNARIDMYVATMRTEPFVLFVPFILYGCLSQDAVLGFEIVTERELRAVFGQPKDAVNATDIKSTKELETLEARPAWEREESSTIVGMNSARQFSFKRTYTSAGNASMVTEGATSHRTVSNVAEEV